MKSTRDRLVVVLGMHRSGTSAVTKGITLLGIPLGDDLHPPGFDNPTGFWEDQSIIEINERLLGLQNSAHDQLSFAWNDFKGESSLDNLKSEAIELVTRKLHEGNGLWGFKDPRTCRLLTFWSEIFEAVDCNVGFVIVLRNPASVVASLQKRNNIPAEKAYALWLQHMLPAIRQTRGAVRVVVDYDNLIDEPYEQLARIATALDLSLPSANSPSFVNFRSEFLEPHLRHSRFSLAELSLDTRAPSGVRRVYASLFDVANDKTGLDSPDVSDVLVAVESELMSVSTILDYLNRLEDDAVHASVEHERIRAANGQMAAQLEDQASELAAYQRQATQFVEELAQAREESRAAHSQIENLANDVAAYQRHVFIIVYLHNNYRFLETYGNLFVF